MSSFKSLAQNGLKRLHLYERAKASLLYDVYWRVADPNVIDLRNREIAFYRDTLRGFRTGDLIFDIGANEGFKTDIFVRLGARVVAVEPDETGQNALTGKFRKFRISKCPVHIEAKAVSDKKGSSTFWVHESGSAKNTLNDKWVRALATDNQRFGERIEFKQKRTVETVTLQNLIEDYGSPFFIKIDVEGAEQSVIAGLKQAVPYLSFEVNLPEFLAEGLNCIEMLQALSSSGRFNYIADSEQRLVLNEWVMADELAKMLRDCSAKSLDIFWRTQYV